jgi:hypothetical protein
LRAAWLPGCLLLVRLRRCCGAAAMAMVMGCDARGADGLLLPNRG